MKSNKPPFPRLDHRQIDIAGRWAIRWLVRHCGASPPDRQAIEQFYKQIDSAFITCNNRLHIQWVRRNTLRPTSWRQEVRSLRRNPKRLRRFAAKDHLAQILRYGAARAQATDDLETLLVQMESDPQFFDQIISLALDEDKKSASERLLHEAGGRPSDTWCYIPIVETGAEIFESVMGRTLGRSTTSEAGMDTRSAGKATGPGLEFLKRLLAPFPRSFTSDQIAHLIRAVLKSP